MAHFGVTEAFGSSNQTESSVGVNASSRDLFRDADFNTSTGDMSTVVALITTSDNRGSNTTEIYYDPIRQPVVMLVVLSVSYSIVFLLALLGNLSVVLVVARDRSLHTATNLFLVNMAVADMLVAIFCLPVTLLSNIYRGKSFITSFVLSRFI